MKYIIDRNVSNPVLVLEDDFLADGEAFLKLEKILPLLPKEWDLFYAGHCHGYITDLPGRDQNGHKIFELDNRLVFCTHAYVINGATAATKYYQAANTFSIEVADWVAHKANLNRYIIYPYLFSQIKEVNADIQSPGGAWHRLKNESISLNVKKLIQHMSDNKD